MFSLFAAAETNKDGLSALGFDPKAFLIQLITFVLAYFVLRRFAFKPIIKILTERRKTIEKGVNLGDEMQKKQAELEATIEKSLRAARQEADKIIASGQDSGRQAVREAEEKAYTKTAAILKEARSRIDQDTARARAQLEKELVGLIADATEAILQEKVDAPKDRELIKKFLKERA